MRAEDVYLGLGMLFSGGCAGAPCRRARAGSGMMLFPPSGAEQLLGSELLCSSFHQRKYQRSKLCCQMPHGHQMFPAGSHQPALPRHRGEGSPSRFHPSCPELPQLSQPHLSRKPLATLGSLQASNEEDRCWGTRGGPLATPEKKPFSSPRSPPALSPASWIALLFGTISLRLPKN